MFPQAYLLEQIIKEILSFESCEDFNRVSLHEVLRRLKKTRVVVVVLFIFARTLVSYIQKE